MVCGEIWLELPVPNVGGEFVEGTAGPVTENGLDPVWLAPVDWVDELFDVASDCKVSQRDVAAPRAMNMTGNSDKCRGVAA
jgi:hypothetical protein